MSKQLPERASLEHLKNEAKALKKAQSLPRLADAQLIVARDYGFPSWSKLKHHVEGFENLRDEFFGAIKSGDRPKVQALLKDSPRLAQSRNPHSFGEVPITAAANRADTGMIDILLKAGADVNARSDWWAGSFGALDIADPETSEYLLKKGATLTVHAAARLGKANQLKQILEDNPESVSERGGDGQFPLQFAGTAEIVDILAEARADLDARDIDHESTAAQWRIKNREVLERLVHHGASTDIFIAVALDNPDLIAKHLQQDPASLLRKADKPGNPLLHPNAPGAPIYVYEIGPVLPLQLAAHLNHMKAFDFLFEKSPPNQKLLGAAWKGDRELAFQFQDEVKHLSKENMAMVAGAARNRSKDLLNLMLELGFDIDAQDHEGMTPTHWCAFHGWREGMEIALQYKPNIELTNNYGGTSLGTLCFGSLNGWYKDGEFAACAQMLIDAGAEIKPDNRGNDDVLAVLDKYR